MAGFTPGPWSVSPTIEGYYMIISLHPDHLDPEKDEWKPNAKLIAASPDLYAALEMAYKERINRGGPNTIAEPGSWIKLAKDALAKARGEL